MIAIIDYDAGNIKSVEKALAYLGEEVRITRDREEILSADKVILPGVGAFGDAAEKLCTCGLADVICREAASGKEIMGICLGMQLLFEESFEYGRHKGLGLLAGSVVPMKGKVPESLKIPHIGWNSLSFVKSSPLMRYVKDGDFVYFVHSYYAADCDDSLIATTDYGIPMTAAVQSGNIMGCQFHPEKSGTVGLSILRAFCEGVSE